MVFYLLEHARLIEECEKLNPMVEQNMAEEWQEIGGETEWFDY